MIVGVFIIVFRPRDFINVGAVLKVKSTLGSRFWVQRLFGPWSFRSYSYGDWSKFPIIRGPTFGFPL